MPAANPGGWQLTSVQRSCQVVNPVYVNVVSSDGSVVAVPVKRQAVAPGIVWCKDRAIWVSVFNVQTLCQIPGTFIKH